MNSSIDTLLHDIKNKVHIVQLNIDLLSEAFKNGNKIKLNFSEVIERVKEALRDIGVMCEVATSGDELEEGQFEVIKVIQRNIENYASQALKFHLNTYARPELDRGEMDFDRVVGNIFKNSKEAGASEINIELRDKSLTIFDNGSGIDNSILLSLKSGLYSSTKSDSRGLGLKSIIDICMKYEWEFEIGNTNLSHSQKKKGIKIRIIF